MHARLANRPFRKAISAAMDLAVIREFWRYLHRSRSPTVELSRFAACRRRTVPLLLRLVSDLNGQSVRRRPYRALLLVPWISDFFHKPAYSPCTFCVRTPKRRIFARISSADLVHLNGLLSSLCAST